MPAIAIVPIDGLPHLPWIAIFQHLDYFSLKKCRRVNKAFKKLTEDPSLDIQLFRSGSLPVRLSLNTYNDWVFHPAIEFVVVESFNKHHGRVSLCNRAEQRFQLYPMKRSRLFNELAVLMPSATLDSIAILVGNRITQISNEYNGDGLTLGQVIDVLGRDAAAAMHDARIACKKKVLWKGHFEQRRTSSGHPLLEFSIRPGELEGGEPLSTSKAAYGLNDWHT